MVVVLSTVKLQQCEPLAECATLCKAGASGGLAAKCSSLGVYMRSRNQGLYPS